MYKIIVVILMLISRMTVAGQEKPATLYNTSAPAAQEIQNAVALAAKEGKHVLIQAGGNWCGWCIRFDKFCKDDPSIDSSLKAAFIIVHLNFSKENYNLPVFTQLGYPQRFGFPVFIVLDGKGYRLHTQNSAYLEKEKSYDREKVLGFLADWSPGALDPGKYKMNTP
jgi:thioredoxin-related protein